MDRIELSRRLFLIKSGAGLSAAWIASKLPEIVAAQEHAHHAAISQTAVKLEFFTKEQAAEVEALAAQIIPTDDTPGAREAGVIYFIDRALTTFDGDKKAVYERGLKDLQKKVKRMKAARLADLSQQQQIKVIKSIEKTEFFGLVRTHTVMGMFANPEYGGNRDQAGWKLIGFEDSFSYDPPFGHYDREYKTPQ